MLLLLSFPRAVRAMACANHSLISSCFSSAYVEILSTWEVWRALKRLELHSAAPRATLTPLSCSPNFPRAQYLDIRTLTHELIVKLRSQYCVLAELSERVMMMLIIIIRAPLTLALPIVVNRKIHRKFKFLFAKSQEIRIPCKTFAKKV